MFQVALKPFSQYANSSEQSLDILRRRALAVSSFKVFLGVRTNPLLDPLNESLNLLHINLYLLVEALALHLTLA